jgi:SHAQKYF class myb-like DNA-binding protein
MSGEKGGTKRKHSAQEEPGSSSEGEEDNWSEELHKHFVEAIYDCGLRHSSPSVIMENMVLHPESLTSERVKVGSSFSYYTESKFV